MGWRDGNSPGNFRHKESRRRKRTERTGLGDSGPSSATTVCAEPLALLPLETASRPSHSPAPAFRTTRRGKWSHSLVASSNLRGEPRGLSVLKSAMCPLAVLPSPKPPHLPPARAPCQAPRAAGSRKCSAHPRGGGCELALAVLRPQTSGSW